MKCLSEPRAAFCGVFKSVDIVSLADAAESGRLEPDIKEVVRAMPAREPASSGWFFVYLASVVVWLVV